MDLPIFGNQWYCWHWILKGIGIVCQHSFWHTGTQPRNWPILHQTLVTSAHIQVISVGIIGLTDLSGIGYSRYLYCVPKLFLTKSAKTNYSSNIGHIRSPSGNISRHCWNNWSFFGNQWYCWHWILKGIGIVYQHTFWHTQPRPILYLILVTSPNHQVTSVGIVGLTNLSLVTNGHVGIGYSRQSRPHDNPIGISFGSISHWIFQAYKKPTYTPTYTHTHKHNITVALTHQHTNTHKDAQTHSLSLTVSLSFSLSLSLIVKPNSSKGNCLPCLCELQIKMVSENPTHVFRV